ncbi:hypothetical protein HU200_014541 [Digitaria exilis]|uniref:Cytochrome b561 domain-containing protein n=1 Tax=Digitaria exilis TaxID=1010633 RepID=A0A835KMT4_9POAL|nr:hypothetical protein HU200_014541 [Digitaria exilis]
MASREHTRPKEHAHEAGEKTAAPDLSLATLPQARVSARRTRPAMLDYRAQPAASDRAATGCRGPHRHRTLNPAGGEGGGHWPGFIAGAVAPATRVGSLKPQRSHAKRCNYRSKASPNRQQLQLSPASSARLAATRELQLDRVSSSLPTAGGEVASLGCRRRRRRRLAMAHGIIGSHHHSMMASRVAMVAHLLFLTTAVLMLVWLLHYRGGINIQSEDPEQIFNKMAHMMIHLVGLILGIFGVYAAFKFHAAAVAPDLTSLHSWLGITAIALFGLQWLFGFVTFWLPAAHERTRAAAAPAHVMAGLAIFMLAVCAAQTGLVQKSAGAASASEMKLINVTGIFILLYGVAVASAVAMRKAFLYTGRLQEHPILGADTSRAPPHDEAEEDGQTRTPPTF